MSGRTKNYFLFKCLLLAGTLIVCLFASSNTIADPGTYPNTIKALQTRYADEIHAHRTYGLYAQQAQKEGHPNVAHLFRSLAASEAVHAKNFKRILIELGQEPLNPPLSDIEISTTKQHLKHATTVEAEEIDNEYPQILAGITSENHQAAIESIQYAWESEKQHRDLIVKIQESVSNWFRVVISRIEGRAAHYHVCQVCGSTLTEVPEKHCPICNHSIEEYVEVKGFPPENKKPPENYFDYLNH